jgi:hypothetical protein
MSKRLFHLVIFFAILLLSPSNLVRGQVRTTEQLGGTVVDRCACFRDYAHDLTAVHWFHCNGHE